MIIFDIDNVLADCSHRMHFIAKNYLKGCSHWHSIPNHPCEMCNECKIKWKNWKKDWPAFYEACDKDLPIEQVISIWNDQISLGMMGNHAIWSDRCESARDQTEKWLDKHLLCFEPHQLKMRPIGNTEPTHVLKERWLQECWPKLEANNEKTYRRTDIEMAFESDPDSIAMYRRRIFVFDCRQNNG